jgi:hypothetical protein
LYWAGLTHLSPKTLIPPSPPFQGGNSGGPLFKGVGGSGCVSPVGKFLLGVGRFLFEVREFLFEPRTLLFKPRTLLFEPRTFLLKARAFLFEVGAFLFEPRTLLFEPRTLLFEPRTLLFEPRIFLFKTRTFLFEVGAFLFKARILLFKARTFLLKPEIFLLKFGTFLFRGCLGSLICHPKDCRGVAFGQKSRSVPEFTCRMLRSCGGHLLLFKHSCSNLESCCLNLEPWNRDKSDRLPTSKTTPFRSKICLFILHPSFLIPSSSPLLLLLA